MFLKTGELKKIMKSVLRGAGLTVGYVNGSYLVYCAEWGVSIEQNFASNKFKAAIMELIGDLPEYEECYTYTMSPEGELKTEAVPDYPDPFGRWEMAKDSAVLTPLSLHAWPHEYVIFQRKSDREFIAADRKLIREIISPRELDSSAESMPGRPSVLDRSILYYKNETTIYWVYAKPCGEKAEMVLFPCLEGMDFFEDSWIQKNDTMEKYNGEADKALPY